MKNTIIEVRTPQAESWIKEVASVQKTAKTGHDWDGTFLNPGEMVDMEIGTIIAVCDKAGTRRNPIKDVDLRVLCPDGIFYKFARQTSNEWAYQLRAPALEWLDLTPHERVVRAGERRLAAREQKLAEATEEARDQAEKNVVNMKKKLDKWRSSADLGQAPAAPDQSPLSGFSDAEIIAEMKRRNI